MVVTPWAAEEQGLVVGNQSMTVGSSWALVEQGLAVDNQSRAVVYWAAAPDVYDEWVGEEE